MKIIRSILIFVLFSMVHYQLVSQTSEDKISDKEWDKLVDLLVKENWSGAEKLSLSYLNKFDEKDDSLAAPAIIRYMYVRCVAAKLGEKEYSKEQALAKTEKLVGTTIITPPKEFIPNGLFNCFSLNHDSTQFYSCSSNESMTVIQIFERYEMLDSDCIRKAINNEYNNKTLRIGAVIKEITAGGYMMPRLEIIFKDAFIWEEE
ncbi:MAG: hypothetical protein WCL06_05010 [Bacteroidota bacterium]